MNPRNEDSSKRRKAAKFKRSLLAMRNQSRTRKLAWWLLMCLFVVGAFIAGFAVRSNTALMLSLGIPMEEMVATPGGAITAKAKTSYDSLSERVSEAEDMLKMYSFDNIRLPEATDALLDGLVESTGDPYAEYFTAERYKTFLIENSDRKSAGVGVLFADYEGRAYAMDVLEGSEAQAEGVRQGDFVIGIDGDRSHTWSASEVITTLTKHEGESVVITWMRPISVDMANGEEFTTTLTCGIEDKKNVEWSLEEEVGYIKLRQFTANSSILVGNALDDLTHQGAKSFVFDVTDNPGGFLTQSLDIASLFIPSGVLVNIETKDGTTTRNASGSPKTSAPLVLLTNEYTSGVGEVLAAALKDNNRATIVGKTTRGKGSVQVTRELSFGGALRYTAAYYLTPQGQKLNGVGVVPNIETGNGASQDGESSPHAIAVEVARSLIPQ